MKKIRNTGIKSLPSTNLVPAAALKKRDANVQVPLIRATNAKLVNKLTDSIAELIDLRGIHAQRAHFNSQLKNLLDERKKNMQLKQDSASEHNNVDSESVESHNANAPAAVAAVANDNVNEESDVNVVAGNPDNTYDEQVKLLEDEIKIADEKEDEIKKSWSTARAEGVFECAYLLIRVCGINVQQLQLLASFRKNKFKYIIWYSLGSFLDDKILMYWVDKLREICNDALYGPFLNDIFKNKNLQYDPKNVEIFNATCITWLQEDSDCGCSDFLQKWDHDTLKALCNVIDFNTPKKDNETQASYELMTAVQAWNSWEKQKDILYSKMRESGLQFRLLWSVVAESTMEDEYNTMLDFDPDTFGKSLTSMTLKMITEECFDDFKQKPDGPDLPTLRLTRDRVVCWIRSSMSTTDPKVALKFSKNMVYGKKCPQWISQCAAPLMFGYLTPLFVINCWEWRKRSGDCGITSPMELISTKRQSKIYEAASIICTYFLKWMKICHNNNLVQQNVLNDSDLKSMVFPVEVKSKIQQIQQTGGKVLDLIKFANANMNIGALTYLKLAFKYPLSAQIGNLVEPKDKSQQLNMFANPSWGQGKTPQMPLGAVIPNSGIMKMPFENAIGVSAGQQCLLFTLTPLQCENYFYAVVSNGNKLGFDAMFYADDGLKFRDSEVIAMNNFISRIGGYPLLADGVFNFEYAYAALHKNSCLLHHKVLTIVQISKCIKQNGKLDKYLTKNGTAFEKGMHSIFLRSM